MEITYKIKKKRSKDSNKSKLGKWVILCLVVFVIGILTGHWSSLMLKELERNKDIEQIEKLEGSLLLYKKMNSILLTLVEVGEAYRKSTPSNLSDRTEEINPLRPKLEALENDFRSLEEKIALLENRKKREMHFDFILPRDSHTSSRDKEMDLCLVKGKVVDVSGSPMAGVEVRIHNTYSSITNEKGEYLIEDVPKGNYFVQPILGSNKSAKRSISISESVQPISDLFFPQPVKEMFFCKAIQKRRSSDNETELVILGQDDAFQADIGRVFCYTHIIGAHRDTVIKHRWFWKDGFQSEVALPVRSSDWRTYSAKHILPTKTGNWRVEVVKADGDAVLASRTFTVR